ncbi:MULTISPECIES: ABC transporter ATP-binding protein [unclassified Mesorhizobium]|uniref:dipeptide ABC transporter ATP-binding protein n=1 Tax=unclassified Mesorhizobium TaxID=325217 RepID=UPI001CCCA444|nr:MULTISPECIES: ABC transporter ATP-binding protein [unclassified Mesorhizobium]MBZ9743243.1 ABC transporter ATP-binding protein [Mesorhizobium sp. CO1-1-4]MBZ9804893.1 ABC transporter ATP-binding protein [Mesorhizobium sp. ES1-6]
MSSSVLNVEHLSVSYRGARRIHRAVDDISLEIGQGEALGLVGESGSGKSSVALAVLRYLPKHARVEAAQLAFENREIRDLSAVELRRLRGDRIAAVYQHPGSALNPSMTIGGQITETLLRHRAMHHDDALGRAAQLLGRVRVANPERVLKLYPHELSGGMQQRANIAIAIALDPALLVMDEPTTALDASVQSEIIAILDDLRREHRTSILLISHDINLIRRSCDRVSVMQAGAIVETGVATEVFDDPRHAYTRALVAAIPTLTRTKRDGRLAEDASPVELAPPAPTTDSIPARPREIAVSCRGIRQAFGGQPVLHGIDLDIAAGETFGLIGESGSGKSTLARIVTGLQPPTAGSVELLGKTVAPLVERRQPAERRDVQMVFQSPDRTLNPRQRIGRILGRPLRRLAGLPRRAVPQRVGDLLASVRLARTTAEQKPGTLSGGQRQRTAIARAFAGLPRLVVLDEPTSALDVSVQATVLNLLNDLQRSKQTAYLFISHDLRVVRYMADRIGVLYRGRLVETGTSDQIFSGPNHPYTQMLLAASSNEGQAATIAEASSAIEAGPDASLAGCAFAARCPLAAEACRNAEPVPREVEPGHVIACWKRAG